MTVVVVVRNVVMNNSSSNRPQSDARQERNKAHIQYKAKVSDALLLAERNAKYHYIGIYWGNEPNSKKSQQKTTIGAGCAAWEGEKK